MATAASMAFPPDSRIRAPASAPKGFAAVTTPFLNDSAPAAGTPSGLRLPSTWMHVPAPNVQTAASAASDVTGRNRLADFNASMFFSRQETWL